MFLKVSGVILAAGEGTRLKVREPKPLVSLLGRKLLDYSIKELDLFLLDCSSKSHLAVVVGHEKDRVEKHLKEIMKVLNTNIYSAYQELQKGTADALKSYLNKVKESDNMDCIIVICSDTPLISKKHIQELFSKLIGDNLDAVVATFKLDNPTGYGRIITGEKGFDIIEEKDVNSEQRKIKEVNSGVYIFKKEYLYKHINLIESMNNSKEFYLTDMFKKGRNIGSVLFSDGNIFKGVNTLEQLNSVEFLMREKIYDHFVEQGVRFQDKNSVYIDDTVTIEKNVYIESGVHLKGKTIIKENSIISCGSIIKDSQIEKEVVIKPYCVIDRCHIFSQASVGPFAHLRPETKIGESSKVGNFVEMKKTQIDKNVKISHLSYVGDADIGENTNIGCGFITCNYDGESKNKTIIGKDSFIGSDSQMIAPVTLGDRCYVASGSTISKDLEDDDFAIARSRQEIKKGCAKKFLKNKK